MMMSDSLANWSPQVSHDFVHNSEADTAALRFDRNEPVTA